MFIRDQIMGNAYTDSYMKRVFNHPYYITLTRLQHMNIVVCWIVSVSIGSARPVNRDSLLKLEYTLGKYSDNMHHSYPNYDHPSPINESAMSMLPYNVDVGYAIATPKRPFLTPEL